MSARTTLATEDPWKGLAEGTDGGAIAGGVTVEAAHGERGLHAVRLEAKAGGARSALGSRPAPLFPAHSFDPTFLGMATSGDDRAALARQLQQAYSGELAAALAYRGHWRATRERDDRARIRSIEEEERHHRGLVGEILGSLGARPRFWLEVRATLIGGTLGLLCHLAGWFLPMYGAGRLERRNVGEYERAARLAVGCGRADLVEGLLAMAEVEWDHEAYFRSRVEGHPGLRWFPLWPPLPPRADIRRSLQAQSMWGTFRTARALSARSPE